MHVYTWHAYLEAGKEESAEYSKATNKLSK